MKKFLVIGNPIKHSLSPQLHNYWIKENKINATYDKKLINENVVEIHYPKTYRDTTTVSHLPSKKAILSWLEMVGFKEIFVSKSYEKENYNVKDIRFACIAKKTKW